jgi:hypothetical protein
MRNCVAWGAVAFGVGFLWSNLFGAEFTGAAAVTIALITSAARIAHQQNFQG